MQMTIKPSTQIHVLEFNYPDIKWRQPVAVKWEGDAGVYREVFACRVCIAKMGLNQHSLHQWPTAEEAQAHINLAHMIMEA